MLYLFTQIECLKTLTPSKKEQHKPYWRGLHESGPSNVQYVHRKNRFKCSRGIAEASASGVDIQKPRRPTSSIVRATKRQKTDHPLTDYCILLIAERLSESALIRPCIMIEMRTDHYEEPINGGNSHHSILLRALAVTCLI